MASLIVWRSTSKPRVGERRQWSGKEYRCTCCGTRARWTRLEATGDIRKVSLWLGHASIQSTEAYLRVDPVEMLEILAARLPPSIVKGSFSGATDRLLAVLADARSA